MNTIHPMSLGATVMPSVEAQSLKETAARRQLKAELFEIKKMLEESTLNDSLTKELRVWCACFCQYINLGETADRAIEAFIPLLRDILIDPLTLNPLGEEPLLGSDLRTYSKMSLTMYYSGVAEKYRNRSPKDPNNETVFTWETHDVAKKVIKWLKDRGEYKPSQQELRQYQELAANAQAPNIPAKRVNSVADRINRLRAIQAERVREEQKNDGSGTVQAAEQEASRIVREAFEPVHARIQQTAEQNMQRVEDNNTRMQASLATIAQEIERLNRDGENLRKANEELNARINQTQASLAQAEKNTMQLERDINEAKRAMLKKKSDWLKDLCTVALVIGASYFGGWAIGQALANMGAAGTTAGVKASEGAIKAGVSIIW